MTHHSNRCHGAACARQNRCLGPSREEETPGQEFPWNTKTESQTQKQILASEKSSNSTCRLHRCSSELKEKKKFIIPQVELEEVPHRKRVGAGTHKIRKCGGLAVTGVHPPKDKFVVFTAIFLTFFILEGQNIYSGGPTQVSPKPVCKVTVVKCCSKLSSNWV